jgi:hypothetical protein
MRQVFAWGGVGGRDGDNHWIDKCIQDQALCARVQKAVGLLKDPNSNLESFNGTCLRMNSAFTKVYPLADMDGSLIIYDGRVGAALAHLARLYLVERGIANIPDNLAFRWGSSRTAPAKGARNSRDPSMVNYRFPRLFGGNRSHFNHARMVQLGSALAKSCTHLIAESSNSTSFIKPSIRQFEAALFMWGYRVAAPDAGRSPR